MKIFLIDSSLQKMETIIFNKIFFKKIIFWKINALEININLLFLVEHVDY